MSNTNPYEEDASFVEDISESSSTPTDEPIEPVSQPTVSHEQVPVELSPITVQEVVSLANSSTITLPVEEDQLMQTESPPPSAGLSMPAEPITDTEADTPVPGRLLAILSVQTPLWRSNSPVWTRRPKPNKRLMTIGAIILALLFVVGALPLLVSYLFTIIPANSATVTITPTSKHLSKFYNIFALPGALGGSQYEVEAHVISYTAQSQSRTVRATGTKHLPAAQATGQLTFSGASDTRFIIAGTTISGYSGVQLALSADVFVSPNHTSTVSAHAVKAGPDGNIPAFDVNSTYIVIPLGGGGSSFTVYVQNTQAFTGGHNAEDVMVVQQSDLDKVANPLERTLTDKAQAEVQSQIGSTEHLVSPIVCTPHVTSNHQVDSPATNVTIKVAVTCQGEVYDQPIVQAMAAELLKQEALSTLGANYALIGNLVTGAPEVISRDDQTEMASLSIKTEGIWVFQFGAIQKQNLAKLLAGKAQQDARKLLLKQVGVSKAIIKTDGIFGNAFPTSIADIKFVVLNVPGL